MGQSGAAPAREPGMPRFLFLLVAGGAGAALFHIMRVVLTGTLTPPWCPWWPERRPGPHWSSP
ncbi:hypothetical protein VQ02_04620 [Methylobacterium variabile]|uniref:Uncharacterized protein n=1 Tax=Methylobacterium variabile TaxID=298794 RepID=A0A0J6VRV2_9HYPH|nr:hypothetical protein VQ02_04620 [Methylobacterium variabile]